MLLVPNSYELLVDVGIGAMLASLMVARIPSRRQSLLLVLVLVLVVSALSSPGRFLISAAAGHLSLMAGAIPLKEGLETGDLSEDEQKKLRWVPRIKAFGEEQVGLSPTRNYETINPDFDTVVWNVSACAVDSFNSHIYRYPIVGRLPYIGYFNREDADKEQQRLESLGLDTWVRSAGAYSTLGWFRDPLWRSMLAWDLDRLANTVLHELVHSTLWLRGHGRFNESFASFVGDRAAEVFVESLAGEQPELLERRRLRQEDEQHYRRSFHSLFRELEGLYERDLPREKVLEDKAAIIAAARRRHASEDWHFPGYARAMEEGRVLNNARLVQFAVYNTKSEVFVDALERFGGDLAAFIRAAQTLEGQRSEMGRSFDPYAAMARLEP